jgi:soluble lytic murein transglycosylase-like protein
MSAGSLAAPHSRIGGATKIAASVAMLVLVALLLAVAAFTGASLEGAEERPAAEISAQPSALAREEIPAAYLDLYEQAAARYGLDWAVLAGIGKVECDHGRDADPACSRAGATNSAGAGGPMQFIAQTWLQYGVDGDGDGRRERWDAADAIYAAANYLRHSGAPGNYRSAIFAYNHADSYVADVERWAARYRGSTFSDTSDSSLTGGQAEMGGRADERLTALTSTKVQFIAGVQAMLSLSDGHQALIPVGVPPVVQAMLVAGDELQELPYGPGGHPDPRGALEEDCSSTVNYVLFRSGVRPIDEIVNENPLAQDYVRWGLPGRGRWVTIYSTTSPTNHTFMTIAGLRLDTSHTGTDMGPNRSEDGPRWRILDHIPTWAHWSVRHPPGL